MHGKLARVAFLFGLVGARRTFHSANVESATNYPSAAHSDGECRFLSADKLRDTY